MILFPGCIFLSRELQILGAIAGHDSEVEDLSYTVWSTVEATKWQNNEKKEVPQQKLSLQVGRCA